MHRQKLSPPPCEVEGDAGPAALCQPESLQGLSLLLLELLLASTEWWFTAGDLHLPQPLICNADVSLSIPAVPVQEGPDAHVGSPGVTACTQLGMHPAPSPGHNPKGRNVFRVELSSWESAGSRLPREARCSRHYSFSQPGRAARMILPHPWGISQERCTSVVSPWAERQTSMCMATINTCVLFARQWKSTTKARRWKDVKAGSEWGKCTFAANGSAGDLQWGVFTSALPLMKSQLGKQCSHWFISCRYCGNTDLLPSLHSSIY